MSDLLKSIDTLLDEAIVSERNSLNIYAKLTEAYEGFINEKFADVVGLHRPNFLTSMIDINNRICELERAKFAVESRISDKDRRDSQNKENRWKESTAKIPQKDEFTLEGIETWHISQFEMNPNYADMHNPLLREEAVKLVASGFSLAFNFSHGTGSILETECGFAIELWQNRKKMTICKDSLDEVIDWIIYFSDQG